MSFKQIAELQIFAKNVKALLPAEPLQFGRMDTAIHASGERAAFEAMAAKIAPAKAGGHRARLDNLGPGLRADRLRADPRRSRRSGQGRGGESPVAGGFGRGGSQIRRNTGPPVRPAACCNASTA